MEERVRISGWNKSPGELTWNNFLKLSPPDLQSVFYYGATMPYYEFVYYEKSANAAPPSIFHITQLSSVVLSYMWYYITTYARPLPQANINFWLGLCPREDGEGEKC